MNNLRIKKIKKHAAWSATTGLLLAVAVLVILILTQRDLIAKTTNQLFGIKTSLDDSKIKLAAKVNEEKTVIDSMNALVAGINYVATEGISKPTNSKTANDDSATNQKNQKVIVRYSTKIQSFTNENALKKDPTSYWFKISEFLSKKDTSESNLVFTRSFDVSKSKMVEQMIYADYAYNPAIHSFSDSYFSDLNNYFNIQKNNQKKLVPVISEGVVQNIEIEVIEKDDSSKNPDATKTICKISTGEVSPTSIENNVDADLASWGNWGKNCKDFFSCDRNADGVAGQFLANSHYGLAPEKIIGTQLWNDPTNSKIYSKFYANNVISANSNEQCLDSPTFLECGGIRVYYCGKTGFQTGELNDFKVGPFLKEENEIHSRTGIKILIISNQEELDTLGSLSQITKRINEKYGVNLKVENQNGGASFLRDKDLKKGIPVTITNTDTGEQIELGSTKYVGIYTPTLFATKKYSPTISCIGGIGFGETSLKCDAYGCNICNFNLPQQIDLSSVANWIAGNGDPKYIVYYEAFPKGEEEAWRIDEESFSLVSIAIWNLAGPILGKTFKLVGTLTKKTITNVATLGFFKVFKSSGNVVGKETEQVAANRFLSKIYGIIDRTGEINKEYSEKLAKKATDIATHSSNPDWLAKSISKKLETSNAAAEAASAKYNLLPGEYSANFKKVLSGRFTANTAERAGFYAVAYAVAQMDSTNDKYESVGINAIGMKKPYESVFYSGDGATISAMDPLVSKYFIALAKDYSGDGISKTLSNQENQRFFLASPCKANLKIIKTKCSCKIPDPKKEYVLKDFGTGQIPTKDDIKYCTPQGEKYYKEDLPSNLDGTIEDYGDATSSSFEDPSYVSECIVIKPEIIDKNSFCYSGSHSAAKVGKWAVYVGSFGVNVAVDSLGIAFAPAGGVSLVAARAINFCVDLTAAWADNYFAKMSKWPNH